MPTINKDNIEGFDAMTPEQKVDALLNYNFEDHAAEVQRLQNAVTKANGEAAEWKRKHASLLTEEERAKQAREDQAREILERNAELEKEIAKMRHKAEFISLGYDDALAESTAQAYADGDLTTFFKNQKAFLESHDKDLKAKLLQGTPKPPAGIGSTEMTKDKFIKLSDRERIEWARNNPDAYKQMYGGNT